MKGSKTKILIIRIRGAPAKHTRFYIFDFIEARFYTSYRESSKFILQTTFTLIQQKAPYKIQLVL
jgi:hypothetical protein